MYLSGCDGGAFNARSVLNNAGTTVTGSERPDFLPTCRMIRRASTSWMFSKHPCWGRTTSTVHSLFHPPTFDPSIHQSTDWTKQQKRKGRHPACVLRDEKGINIVEDAPASSLVNNIIQSTFYVHSSSKPNIRPSNHLSTDWTKKQKARLPTCVLDDEKGINVMEDIQASSLGRTSSKVHSTFTLPATHPSIHSPTYPLTGQRNKRERTDFPPVCLMFSGLSTSWRMPQPMASSLEKNIIQSTFTLPATTHSSIHPFTYPLNRQRNNRERTDFPPVCLMTRQALTLRRTSQHPPW